MANKLNKSDYEAGDILRIKFSWFNNIHEDVFIVLDEIQYWLVNINDFQLYDDDSPALNDSHLISVEIIKRRDEYTTGF